MISQRAADIAYVDMRYSNGFAIGWRGGSTRLAASAGQGRERLMAKRAERTVVVDWTWALPRWCARRRNQRGRDD